MIEFLRVGSAFQKVLDSLNRVDEKRRLQIADYLDRMAVCLGKMAQTAEEGGERSVLYGLCTELDVYAENASPIVESALGRGGREIRQLLNDSMGAPATWRDLPLIRDLGSDGDARRTKAIRDLREAEGALRGVSNTLRAPRPPIGTDSRLFRWGKK